MLDDNKHISKLLMILKPTVARKRRYRIGFRRSMGREFSRDMRMIGVGAFNPPGYHKTNEWVVTPYAQELDAIQAAYERGHQRAQTPFPKSLIYQLKQARRERILNKTKERLRELRGEQIPSLLKKLRQGPPAWVLKNMSSRQRYLDKVARSPSEVGMVARAKRELGRGMKNPTAYLVEDSLEKKEELDVVAREIRRGNVERG